MQSENHKLNNMINLQQNKVMRFVCTFQLLQKLIKRVQQFMDF